ncbi:3',5'-cyclic-nucleotide phosphodiesterase [Geotalea sp. SG265]|uniref:3',5'-cyclic-nucleotide phosphodiesterase n=1 Tax=Geotalea sp. SG265 TaxID=2922867 RepID=UPI001FAE77A3|nr:3',5'-cyclic-nucleotide phosphodiesterase [Geotalea sp. SG265]
MRLRVLGCAGAEFPHFHPSAFLVDESLLLDAGTIGAVLSEHEQWAIAEIFITHAHLDHIRGIPMLADNIVIKELDKHLNIYGIDATIDSLGTHLLNDVIWPDFSKIPPAHPVIRYRRIVPEVELEIGAYRVTAVAVNHTVPAVGYIVRKGNKSIMYTGDTGPTERLWEFTDGLSALIIEVSFPNEMEELALLTRHLTPALLARELKKIKTLPPRILVTHPKPQHYDKIASELDDLGNARIELLRDGNVYEL